MESIEVVKNRVKNSVVSLRDICKDCDDDTEITMSAKDMVALLNDLDELLES